MISMSWGRSYMWGSNLACDTLRLTERNSLKPRKEGLTFCSDTAHHHWTLTKHKTMSASEEVCAQDLPALLLSSELRRTFIWERVNRNLAQNYSTKMSLDNLYLMVKIILFIHLTSLLFYWSMIVLLIIRKWERCIY